MTKAIYLAVLQVGISAFWLSTSAPAAFAGRELSVSSGNLIQGSQIQGANGSHVGFNQVSKNQFATSVGQTNASNSKGSLNAMHDRYAQSGVGWFNVSNLNAQSASGASVTSSGAGYGTPGGGSFTAHSASATNSSGQSYSYSGSSMFGNKNPSYVATFTSPKQTVTVDYANGALNKTVEANN
jgi:hypothetical protein